MTWQTCVSVLRRVLSLPSVGTIALMVGVLAWWCFVLVGAAIFQAVENPTREQSGPDIGQNTLEYIDGTLPSFFISFISLHTLHLTHLFLLQHFILWRYLLRRVVSLHCALPNIADVFCFRIG